MQQDNRPYWQRRRDLKLKTAVSPVVIRKEKKTKEEFFTESIKRAPKRCENCNKSLAGTISINAAAVVCHILPKSKKDGVPSVATEAQNVWFGCGDCHTDYDTKGAQFVQSMKIFPVLVKRVSTILHLIAPEEMRRVPAYFLPEHNI